MIDRVFYVSTATPQATSSRVARIFSVARARNGSNDITGFLLFDGECFLQYLEGDFDALHTLVARIVADDAHRTIKMLPSPAIANRHVQSFSAGFCEAGIIGEISAIATSSPERAITAVLGRKELFDLQ